jgi:hypothetical protein
MDCNFDRIFLVIFLSFSQLELQLSQAISNINRRGLGVRFAGRKRGVMHGVLNLQWSSTRAR